MPIKAVIVTLVLLAVSMTAPCCYAQSGGRELSSSEKNPKKVRTYVSPSLQDDADTSDNETQSKTRKSKGSGKGPINSDNSGGAQHSSDGPQPR